MLIFSKSCNVLILTIWEVFPTTKTYPKITKPVMVHFSSQESPSHPMWQRSHTPVWGKLSPCQVHTPRSPKHIQNLWLFIFSLIFSCHFWVNRYYPACPNTFFFNIQLASTIRSSILTHEQKSPLQSRSHHDLLSPDLIIFVNTLPFSSSCSLASTSCRVPHKSMPGTLLE